MVGKETGTLMTKGRRSSDCTFAASAGRKPCKAGHNATRQSDEALPPGANSSLVFGDRPQPCIRHGTLAGRATYARARKACRLQSLCPALPAAATSAREAPAVPSRHTPPKCAPRTTTPCRPTEALRARTTPSSAQAPTAPRQPGRRSRRRASPPSPPWSGARVSRRHILGVPKG